jgi:hypothetical protein
MVIGPLAARDDETEVSVNELIEADEIKEYDDTEIELDSEFADTLMLLELPSELDESLGLTLVESELSLVEVPLEDGLLIATG